LPITDQSYVSSASFRPRSANSVAWKLVHFLEQSCGQLFDLANDPDEIKNLWESTDGAHIRRKRELLAVLRE
jgi:hypothetical protein